MYWIFEQQQSIQATMPVAGRLAPVVALCRTRLVIEPNDPTFALDFERIAADGERAP